MYDELKAISKVCDDCWLEFMVSADEQLYFITKNFCCRFITIDLFCLLTIDVPECY